MRYLIYSILFALVNETSNICLAQELLRMDELKGSNPRKTKNVSRSDLTDHAHVLYYQYILQFVCVLVRIICTIYVSYRQMRQISVFQIHDYIYQVIDQQNFFYAETLINLTRTHNPGIQLNVYPSDTGSRPKLQWNSVQWTRCEFNTCLALTKSHLHCTEIDKN